MKLAVISDDGEVVIATEELEDCNLDNSLVRVIIIDSIKDAIRVIQHDIQC